MMGLSDGERILMIRSSVLTQITRVTDGQMELAWHIRTIAYMLSCIKTDIGDCVSYDSFWIYSQCTLARHLQRVLLVTYCKWYLI